LVCQDHRVQATDEGHRVTAFEVFFDLVFVFAFTRIISFMAADLTPLALVRGLILLVLMWWAWSAYTWLGNQARADVGPALAAGVAAMAATFVVALVLPDAWHDVPGGLDEPLILALAYTVVRVLYLATYLHAAAGDRRLRRQLLLNSIASTAGWAAFIAGALIGGGTQVVLWAATFVIDFAAGRFFSTYGGYRVRSPAYFAERHRLVVIIALGESLAVVGTGFIAAPVSLATLTVALLGFVLTVLLWLLYFRPVAPGAETRLTQLQGAPRAWLARDIGTLLHFPLITGVIYIALGVDQVLKHASSSDAHDNGRPLGWLALIALYGGVAVYLAALAAIYWQTIAGARPVAQCVGAAVPLMLLPAARAIPAPAALGLITVALAGLALYPWTIYRMPTP
jgi:low temperature requirement protein LtrA